MSQMDKRAHHNALERKRRDHIKDSFTGLRDAIPTMKGGDKSSRAQILKKASEYIQVIIRFEIVNLLSFFSTFLNFTVYASEKFH